MSKNQFTGTATQPNCNRKFCQFNNDQYCICRFILAVVRRFWKSSEYQLLHVAFVIYLQFGIEFVQSVKCPCLSISYIRIRYPTVTWVLAVLLRSTYMCCFQSPNSFFSYNFPYSRVRTTS